jgi:hypothetical protein
MREYVTSTGIDYTSVELEKIVFHENITASYADELGSKILGEVVFTIPLVIDDKNYILFGRSPSLLGIAEQAGSEVRTICIACL